jgi:hypothetical protein
MINTASRFSHRSREVVARFLQSAVIVDDEAHFGRESRPQEVVSPGRMPRLQAAVPLETLKEEERRASHDLDAKVLVDAFAELGIVCAVLKATLGAVQAGDPQAEGALDKLSDRTGEATRRADIVILDWNMPNEEGTGKNAKRLIERILTIDRAAENYARPDDHSRRLRLIAIYTGESDLESIRDELRVLLGSVEVGKVGPIECGEYCVSAGPVTLVVYGKANPIIRSGDASRRVTEDELPGLLQGDFARMTEGLLSNSALASLSAIRTNTHRILSRFHRRIDPAYVAHRAMLQPPEEAEEHPVPLIASEIEGVLADDARIPGLVELEAIREWLDHIALKDEDVEAAVGMNAAAFKAALLSLLEFGLEKTAERVATPDWHDFLNKLERYDPISAGILTQALAPAGMGNELDMEFARLTSLRSRYDEPPPILGLGSIVATRENANSLYLLCIQPLCDSVRLNRSRKFTFLKLKERATSDEAAFDLVVSDGEECKRLYISRKAYDIRVIEMKHDPSSRSVRADRKASGWEFQRKASGQAVRWLADLKPDFARRIVNEFVGDIARVGLTESEWLRRMARRPQPGARQGSSISRAEDLENG